MSKRKAEGDAAPGEKSFLMFNGTDKDRRAIFARNLAALNTQFATWVADQLVEAPKQLWTDGVEDYLKYAKQLMEDFKDVLEAEGDKKGQDAAPAGGSLFGFGAAAGGAAAAAPPAGSSKPPLAPSTLFSGGSSSSAASAPASIFGALPSTGGAFAFGSSAPAFGGFGGSGAGSAANSGGSLFNVPSTGTLGSSFTSGAAGAEEEGGDEEGDEQQNEEPSVQVEAGEGTEMVLKQRAKLMSMAPDKTWVDKGQGTLTLRRVTGDDSKRPYFVFTTDAGRVLINAPLLANMKPTRNPKTPKNVIMFLVSNVDGKEERGTHIFKCDTQDAANQLMKTVTELA